MTLMRHFFRTAASVLILTAVLRGDSVGSRPAAVTKVLELFDHLQTAQQQKARGQKPQHVGFNLTEQEINEYSAYALRTTPRPGLRSVSVKVFPNNYISTLTVIDFDAVERWKPGTIPTLLKPVLTGQKTIWMDYRFQAANGRTTFSVEKAYFEKLRLPAFFIEKMIQIVASRQPEHYDTTKPLPLPFGLEKVWTNEHAVAGEN